MKNKDIYIKLNELETDLIMKARERLIEDQTYDENNELNNISDIIDTIDDLKEEEDSIKD